MVWLLTHMWVGLALAALFGLIFGWAIRGWQLKGRARDAIVARDIVLTELEQSRLEVDQLYAAQSKGVDAAAQAGDEALQRELEAREDKLQALSKELAASQSALEDLKAKAVAGAGVAAAVSGVAGAALGNGQANQEAAERLDAGLNVNDASLAWRNRYLASRIRALESEPAIEETVDETHSVDASVVEALEADLAAAKLQASDAESALEAFKTEAESDKQNAISLALAASGAGAIAGAVIGQGGDDRADTARSKGSDLGAQKRGWQNTYLRNRLAFGQQALSAQEQTVDEAEKAGVEEETGVEVEEPTLIAAPVELEKDAVQAEKQAWQNDYLRRRVAFMEHSPPKDRPAVLADEGDGDEAGEEAPETVEAGDLPPQSADIAAGDAGELEQELARLRWRNRYLEGRLAYIDGDAVSSEAVPDALASDDAVTPEPDNVDDTPTPAEAVLAAMDLVGGELSPEGAPEKPESLERPDEDHDDLTRIDGVDAETAKMLNALGIWHFHQIAAWTRENTSWMNAYFQAENRIEDQEWVSQAGALSLGASFN